MKSEDKKIIIIIIGIMLLAFTFYSIYEIIQSIKITIFIFLIICFYIFKFITENKEKKKYKTGKEYGSAKWADKKELDPLKAKNEDNKVLLTETESIMINERPSEPKFDRNKNILVIGGSGSGKTRFFIKPNLMQMHSSYCITDPKGTIALELGTMLKENGYDVKIFNTINLLKSFHYNPFKYIKSQFDVLSLTEVLIQNTKGEGEKAGEDFWVKAEKLLYQALISIIFYHPYLKEKNIPSLLDMINSFKVDEDDPDRKDSIDFFFEDYEKNYLKENFLDEENNVRLKKLYSEKCKKIFGDISEEEINNKFEEFKNERLKNRLFKSDYPIKQFKKYKLAAGKTAKSILISCAARLAPFEIDELRMIMQDDNLELDKIGGYKDIEGNIVKLKTALFLIISDTDTTLNFIIAILFSQLFNLLCKKADDEFNGKLPIHVRCLLDEFANIGLIPRFEKLIATIRSREISASVVLQAKSQLKAIYKDNTDTIIGNCDTTLFLGGQEESTLKNISEMLGKETIDIMTTSSSFSQNKSSSVNYNRLGKELMSVNEIFTMDGGKCILRIRGFNPFFSNKYDILKHKRVNQTTDGKYGDSLIFDLKSYINNYKKFDTTNINIDEINSMSEQKLKLELLREPRLISIVNNELKEKIEKIGVYEFSKNL